MPEDLTRDFGAFLRDGRERMGVSLRVIANNTKISVPTLEALERNDGARLPGGIFIRSFVRAYASEVGLDPEDAGRRFVARFPDASMEESPTPYEANQEKIVVDEEPTTGRLGRVEPAARAGHRVFRVRRAIELVARAGPAVGVEGRTSGGPGPARFHRPGADSARPAAGLGTSGDRPRERRQRHRAADCGSARSGLSLI